MYKCININNGLQFEVTEAQKEDMENGMFKKSFRFEPIPVILADIPTPPEAEQPKKAKEKATKKAKGDKV